MTRTPFERETPLRRSGWFNLREIFVVLMTLTLGTAASGQEQPRNLVLGSGAPPTNRGVALLLHADATLSIDSAPESLCGIHLDDWRQARTRLPGDGRWHVVVAYAVAPADSTLDVNGVTFGIRHTPNVRVLSSGSCNGADGIAIPQGKWPASDTGISMVFVPRSVGPLVPIHWFIVNAKGPGYFEATPNPDDDLGGNVANSYAPPQLAAFSAYGRIGFELDGALPTPGADNPDGICCLEEKCIGRSRLECAFYHGDFLGPVADCDRDRPCRPEADRGGCCLPGGCELRTLRSCALAGGRFLGEKTGCAPDACAGGK